MSGKINIRGKNLFVNSFGNENSVPLLYLHGGPGVGSYDFELFQGQRISKKLHLITFDQRGVLRSDPLQEDEKFELNDLVEDCEALRKSLGIDRWSVLGHSFGGYIGLLYSNTYPDSIDKLIFESPTFDLSLSARSLIRGAAGIYLNIGDEERATMCLKAAEKDYSSLEELFNICFNQILNNLGDRREDLYTHGPDKYFFDRVVSEAPFPKEWWGKQQMFQKKLYSEGAIYQSIMSMLHQIKCPALLLKGVHDYVTCDIHVQTFLKNVKYGYLKFFEDSGHMPRFEEPERYAETVIQFVLRDSFER
ncbi:proline iminopeptidase [Paenibacillus sp. yr247]|uniref:alpha/beta fold hydrolase n=1 Tax=Paenibacillus sp. yr247 TaxID=1761880 RepID=UPI00089225B3|nr:alpha/beta fold hydrolase [Paenibacillus sp. yr247]SDN67405.1 proline iminopeptidase [Paenibacillus sp. yr247]